VASPNPLLDLPGMAELRQRIEQKLLAVVETNDPRLTEMTSHLVRAGGKRLRPTLCALSSVAGRNSTASTSATSAPSPDADHPLLTGISEDAVTAGVSIELVHVGSLHHDDVIDESTTRHSVDSVNSRWGNLRAILSGDYLLAKASLLAAELGRGSAELLASTIGTMCVGATQELHFTYRLDRSEPDYFAAIEGKTAALYATACRLGAAVAEAPEDHVETLTQFGSHYGMAFQLVDDVLDVVSTEAELGKPAGHDMAEGVYNLPVLRALAGPNGSELRKLLGGALSDEARLQALELVRDSDGVAGTMRAAHEYVERALSSLASMPADPATEALRTAATHLVSGLTPEMV
jgi:heptaprenyl diphosphate synthase